MTEPHGATRREFLAAGAQGLAGAALAASCSTGQTPASPATTSIPASVRTLGRTGMPA